MIRKGTHPSKKTAFEDAFVWEDVLQMLDCRDQIEDVGEGERRETFNIAIELAHDDRGGLVQFGGGWRLELPFSFAENFDNLLLG